MIFLGIEVFLAIVESKSLSKAAEILHLSQSTVTQRLKSLEREFNATLIERKRGYRTIELTPKGKEFLSIAEQWMALLKDTNILQSTESHIPLSIGCVDSLNTYIFPPLYKKLLNHEIPIDLRIRTHQSNEIYNLLENREIDIGFVLRKIKYKNIIIEPVFEEKMVLIRSSDEFNCEGPINPNDLDLKNEMFLNWGPDYQYWHDYWWEPHKYPHVWVDTASVILSLMNDPSYWAIVPISMAQSFKKQINLKICDIKNPPPNRICYKITHMYPKPSHVKSIEIINKYLETFKYPDSFSFTSSF